MVYTSIYCNLRSYQFHTWAQFNDVSASYDAVVRIGHTSIYQYTHSIYTVHHHTSFGIRFDPPCAADESQLHACGFHPCELASSLQSPQLTGHPGAACHAQIATATD